MSYQARAAMKQMPPDVLFSLWWTCQDNTVEVSGQLVLATDEHATSERSETVAYPQHSESEE